MPEANNWSEFRSVSKNDWAEAAKGELDNAEPFGKLRSSLGNIIINPYYDISDVAADKRMSLPASDSWLGVRAWNNAPRVVVEHENVANNKALEHLQNGADGILFEIKNEQVDVAKLLSDIQLGYCSVFFLPPSAKSFVSALSEYLKKTSQSEISGAIYQSNVSGSYHPGKLSAFHGSPAANATLFHAGGIVFENTTDLVETKLTNILLTLVEQIEGARATGATISEALGAQSIMLTPGNNFFVEIALLKSLRVLWKGIAKAYGNPDSNIFIHCNTAPWIAQAYQPHGNLISETTRALSSILGGCDALTLDPENNDILLSRISRNTSLVLREESHLAKVADPTAGSYYIDALVGEITEKSWNEFQKRMR